MPEPKQGHTVRVSKENDKWIVKCLTCLYHGEADTEIEAAEIKGYHFGRLSTLTWPYGSFKDE